MLNILRNKQGQPPNYLTETETDGQLTVAIGDVHGCYEPLVALLKKIRRLKNRIPHRKFKLVFLGDLIDRGPQSYETVDLIRRISKSSIDTVTIMGNHEEVFLDILDGNWSLLRQWFEFGGQETARSYGVKDLGLAFSDPVSLLKKLRDAVPKDHIDFMRGFKDGYIFDDIACVHAGVRPKVPLLKQDPADLRWIREPFLESKRDHGYKILHGHTIVEVPELKENRIALDTGSYKTGILTAAYFMRGKVGFLRSDDHDVMCQL